MPKLHSFLYVIHKATAETKSQAHDWCKKQKMLWYVIALEPYIKKDEKDGFHLHLMFRVKNPRATTAITNEFMRIFDKPREDIWQERLQGRFSDQKNYITNEYAGEHADDPKVLDPSPIIYPESGDPDAIAPKVSKKQIVQDILHGASYKWLLKTYPEFCFTYSAYIHKFMEEAEKASLIKRRHYDGSPVYGEPSTPARVSAPWEKSPGGDWLSEIFFLK